MTQKITLSDALETFRGHLKFESTRGEARNGYSVRVEAQPDSIVDTALRAILAAADEMAKGEEGGRQIRSERAVPLDQALELLESFFRNDRNDAYFRWAHSSHYAECVRTLIAEVKRKQGERAAALELGTKLHEKIEEAIASATRPAVKQSTIDNARQSLAEAAENISLLLEEIDPS